MKQLTIGLVVPYADDKIPPEGPMMYPEVAFIPRGVGVRALTPTGYDHAWSGILPAAEHLAKQGVDAIMVIGTSLTFYRGYEMHRSLLDQLRRSTGLPVSTMSEAIVDGLNSVGAKRIAVATAYGDEVNKRLADFLAKAEFDVLSLEGFGLVEFSGPARQSEQDIIALGSRAIDKAKSADAALISCGGLMTFNCIEPLEQRHDIAVVTSTQAAFWKAMRLAGRSGRIGGHGRMLGQSSAADA